MSSEQMERELVDHCQMSWSTKGMPKVFKCRQCGEEVIADYHPYRRCPAYTRAAAQLAKGAEK